MHGVYEFRRGFCTLVLSSLWYGSISIIAVQFNDRRCLLQGNVLINREVSQSGLSSASYDSGHDIESVEHQVAVQQ